MNESGLVTCQELASKNNAKCKKYSHKLPGAGRKSKVFERSCQELAREVKKM
jgi:hypothetical protein